jgi:hypothetical protein
VRTPRRPFRVCPSRRKKFPSPVPSTTPSATPVPSDAAISAGSTTGTFIGLEWGDYLHLGIRTGAGDEVWFWVRHDVGIDPETLEAGQKVEISWENRDVYIEEADEIINMDVVANIRVLSD